MDENVAPPVTDVATLRALAHPTRLAVYEAVGVHGTLTATQASEIVGESPTNCAFHLRTLAKYGFVVEAEGGKGRERPWRLVRPGFSLAADTIDDPTGKAASLALAQVMVERWINRIRAFEATRAAYPREIRDLTSQSQHVWFVTVDEMRELNEELSALMLRYADRVADSARRPEGAIPFEGLLFIHPLSQPTTDHKGD